MRRAVSSGLDSSTSTKRSSATPMRQFGMKAGRKELLRLVGATLDAAGTCRADIRMPRGHGAVCVTAEDHRVGTRLNTNELLLKHRVPAVPTVQPKPPPTDDGTWSRRDWASGYASASEEGKGYWMEVEGSLPAELKGTYFRNGPGSLEIGTQTLNHPYDSYGLVASISFRDGRAYFRSKTVRTAEYTKESEAEEVLFRATFGTQRRGGAAANFLDVLPKNVANTNVLLWGKRCWALFEASQPHEIDPHTLETKGLDFLNGHLREGLPFGTGLPILDNLLGMAYRLLPQGRRLPRGIRFGGDALTAHPRIDPRGNRLVLYSYNIRVGLGLKAKEPWNVRTVIPGLITEVTFWEFDEDMKLMSKRKHELPGYAFLHDFAVTENHYVIFHNPVSLDLAPFVLGRKCPVHCVKWKDGARPLKVHVIPRDASTSVGVSSSGAGSADPKVEVSSTHALERESVVLEADPAFVFHLANAYEEDGGRRLVVDCVQYPRLFDFHQVSAPGRNLIRDIEPDEQPASQLWRYRLDLEAKDADAARLSQRSLEFPHINDRHAGQPHRYVYAAAARHPTLNRPQQAIMKLDTASGRSWLWAPHERYYVNEPQFVPRPARPGGAMEAAAEDDGWVVVIGYDAARRRSECVVLDAADIERGPLAVLPLRAVMPYGLHSSWDDTFHGP